MINSNLDNISNISSLVFSKSIKISTSCITTFLQKHFITNVDLLLKIFLNYIIIYLRVSELKKEVVKYNLSYTKYFELVSIYWVFFPLISIIIFKF